MSEKTYLVAGLGNIGSEYAATRHNVGFMILDAWAQASDIVFSTERYGDVAHLRLKGRDVYLLKPSTYMNLSGNAIRYWAQKLDIPLENVLVICDDLNLPFGTPRMRLSGSDGGHNGLKNIIELLQTQEFARIRVGIGHDFTDGAQIDFVLSPMSEAERAEINTVGEKVIQAVKDWIFVGGQRAMSFLNAKTQKN
ncbi:MAG: aminoacyl-tRNA hydrolase [Bacteroidales bacterium]|nr:aminoacyl-tRNA hydrolase [Bacteroidales bacterium]